ncbi:MAG: MFS transporter [Clostridia bacterium]|nr:MFS transporter [Clostridia bacterium]
MSNPTFSPKKPITNKLLWLFAVGQFGWSLLSGLISSWMVYYYIPAIGSENSGIFGSGFITQDRFFLGLTIFGIIMMIGRIFDAVTDPLVASWSDRSTFKGGRRIPFMKAVAIPFALITVGVFVFPQVQGNEVLNDIIIFVTLILFYLFMTIYCTPYNALISEFGDTQEHRINVSTYISLTYIAGLTLAFLVPNLAGFFEGALGTANAIRLAIGIMAFIACVAMILPSFLIKERDYIEAKPVQTPAFKSLFSTFKNGQFRRFVYSDVIYFFAVTLFQTGLAYYETLLMHIPASNTFMLMAIMTVVSLILYLPVNRLATKLGKKRLIIVGFFTYAFVFFLASICGNWFPGIVWGILIAVCAGVPMAILGILPQACVADVAEVEALKTGENRSGMFFAARTFAMKMGQALAVVLFTAVTSVAAAEAENALKAAQEAGLDPNAIEQTISAEGEMSFRITAIIATVACLIGAVLFFFYNEKKLMGEINELKAGKPTDGAAE